MTAPRPDDMQNYINAADKMGADDMFYDRMSQCIDNYEENMVCGAERVIRPSIRRRVTAIAAAVVVCCMVGLTGYRLYQNVKSELSGSPGRSEHSELDSDTSIVWESLKRQLADAESKQREHEAKCPEKGSDSYDQWKQDYAEWEKTALQLQNEIEAITAELCLSGNIMIASSFWDLKTDQIRLYLINGTDHAVTLPQYYQLFHESQMKLSGSACMINRWSLPKLNAHSSMVIYCNLGVSSGASDLAAVLRNLEKGDYQLRLCNTLGAETESAEDCFAISLSLRSDDKIRFVNHVTDLQLEEKHPLSWHNARATIETIMSYRQEMEARSDLTDEVLCNAIKNYVIQKNGDPDIETASDADAYYGIYYLTEDRSAYICNEQSLYYYYVFEHPQTGEIFRGSLLTIGTFGEKEILNLSDN